MRQCATPSDSLYFSEMTRTQDNPAAEQEPPEGKTTPKADRYYSTEEAVPKVGHEPTQPDPEGNQSWHKRKATHSGHRRTQKAHALQTRYCSASGDPSLPENNRTVDPETALFPG